MVRWPGLTGEWRAAEQAYGKQPSAAASVQGASAAVRGRRLPLPADDRTFRPTVMIRRGTSQGSGTIIASVTGETLILTAAHVVRDRGPITVELHRYNLGLERSAPTGRWPRRIPAVVAASDRAADLAVLRIERMRALPYVARLARDGTAPADDTVVTSVGIDLGTELAGWDSRVLDTLTFDLSDGREARPFVITEKIPENGRSGGGLFLATGELVGVCIGHAELEEGRRAGVFASRESIRLLLDDHKLTTAIVRSETRRTRLSGRLTKVNTAPGTPSRSVVTPTVSAAAGERAHSEP